MRTMRQNKETVPFYGNVAPLHVFNPDHQLYCLDCGSGELMGNHGMIPGDGGASGHEFSPQYASEAVRDMYNEALGLSEYEEQGPDWLFRAFLEAE